MLAKRHSNALEGIIKLFEESGYLVSYKLLKSIGLTKGSSP